MVDRSLLLEKLPAATAYEFTDLQRALLDTDVSVGNFISKFGTWVADDQLNELSGFEEFQHRDACFGVTHFIDTLVMKHGAGIQNLEHDYLYYKRMWPNKAWSTVGNLVPGVPLLMAVPFPGYARLHPAMDEILSESLDKGIDVHLDCAWLPASRGIRFDFAHPAIKSFAISLSKGLDLGWNRIAVRYSREHDPTDPITIANKFGMINQSCLGIGYQFMDQFPMNFLWNKYGSIYDEACVSLRLRPTNLIHVMLDLQTRKPLGTRDLLLSLSH